MIQKNSLSFFSFKRPPLVRSIWENLGPIFALLDEGECRRSDWQIRSLFWIKKAKKSFWRFLISRLTDFLLHSDGLGSSTFPLFTFQQKVLSSNLFHVLQSWNAGSDIFVKIDIVAINLAEVSTFFKKSAKFKNLAFYGKMLPIKIHLCTIKTKFSSWSGNILSNLISP